VEAMRRLLPVLATVPPLRVQATTRCPLARLPSGSRLCLSNRVAMEGTAATVATGPVAAALVAGVATMGRGAEDAEDVEDGIEEV
jgi:hypothetical protein